MGLVLEVTHYQLPGLRSEFIRYQTMNVIRGSEFETVLTNS